MAMMEAIEKFAPATNDINTKSCILYTNLMVGMQKNVVHLIIMFQCVPYGSKVPFWKCWTQNSQIVTLFWVESWDSFARVLQGDCRGYRHED